MVEGTARGMCSNFEPVPSGPCAALLEFAAVHSAPWAHVYVEFVCLRQGLLQHWNQQVETSFTWCYSSFCCSLVTAAVVHIVSTLAWAIGTVVRFGSID